MKIILQQDVAKLGKEGEVVTVADGYARNFLLPRNLAVTASGGALKTHQRRIAATEARDSQIKAQADKDAETLNEKTVKIAAQSGSGDRLYGSITTQDIADAIKRDLGVAVDKRKIHLANPIKALGTFTAPIKLHKDVSVAVTVEVNKAA
ncbi:MAG: 50S ribosomal protein L9 [bacterium]|jgi:large subunit ribosomal protein L9